MRIYRKSLIVVIILVTTYICFTLRTGFKFDDQVINIDSSSNDDRKIYVDLKRGYYDVTTASTPNSKRDGTTENKEAKCNINGEQTIKCLKNDNEIYVPFSFVKQYFEIYGDVKSNTLFWQHSNARIIMLGPEGYQSDGVFMSFDHYNVEGRERVFCLTGAEGVPYSTQWARKPYPYTIQVAQFGLSHYSKLLRESKGKASGRQTVGTDKNDWDISDDCDFTIDGNSLISYSCPTRSTIDLPLTEIPTKLATMTLDVHLSKGSSVTMSVELPGRKEVHIVFTPGNSLLNVSRDKKVVRYGIGSPNKWVKLIRMPKVDIRKGYASMSSGKKGRKRKKGAGNRRRNKQDQSDGSHLKIRSYRRLILRGSGQIRKISFATANHKGMFIQAAKWMVRHQSESGGWPVPVRRRFGSSNLSPLPPGWLSAMAQGHAMSILSRAYTMTKDSTYLDAALKGTQPFEILVKDGGVRTLFANKHVWYEEYPTTPSLFVLNGFIYSLIGLYDVAIASDPSTRGAKAFELYKEGLKSLDFMLPFFDTGSGSFYDLRHVTLHSKPNLARWDYHSTHITQLLLLNSIDKQNPLWLETATRWLSYTRGQRAPHN